MMKNKKTTKKERRKKQRKINAMPTETVVTTTVRPSKERRPFYRPLRIRAHEDHSLQQLCSRSSLTWISTKHKCFDTTLQSMDQNNSTGKASCVVWDLMKHKISILYQEIWIQNFYIRSRYFWIYFHGENIVWKKKSINSNNQILNVIEYLINMDYYLYFFIKRNRKSVGIKMILKNIYTCFSHLLEWWENETSGIADKRDGIVRQVSWKPIWDYWNTFHAWIKCIDSPQTAVTI